MRKILFISTGYPSDLGGMKRLSHEIEDFSRVFEVHFIQVDLGDGARAKRRISKRVKFTRITPSGTSIEPLCFLLPLPAWKRACCIKSAKSQVQAYIDKHEIDAIIIHPIDTCLALRDLKAPVKVAELLDSAHSYYCSKNRVCPTLVSLAMEWSQAIFTPLLHVISGRAFDLMVFVSVVDTPKGSLGKKCVALEARDAPLRRETWACARMM